MQTTQDLRATTAGDLAGVIECRNAGVPIDCHDEVSETIRTQIESLWRLSRLLKT